MIFRFDPARDLIFVDVKIVGRRATQKFSFVLDTGCAETLIRPEALDDSAVPAVSQSDGGCRRKYSNQLRIISSARRRHRLSRPLTSSARSAMYSISDNAASLLRRRV